MNEMKQSRAQRLALVLTLLATAMMLMACGANKSMQGTKTPPAMQGNAPGEQGRGVQGRNIDVRGLEGIPKEDRAMFTDPDNPLSVRTIYFAFDSSAIQQRFAPVIKAHAKYLANHPKVNLRLEGHTDERGTREYNVALGERRAESVKQSLVISGAKPGQITTLSFGEERPAVLGSTPEAYAKNRRVELVYVE